MVATTSFKYLVPHRWIKGIIRTSSINRIGDSQLIKIGDVSRGEFPVVFVKRYSESRNDYAKLADIVKYSGIGVIVNGRLKVVKSVIRHASFIGLLSFQYADSFKNIAREYGLGVGRVTDYSLGSNLLHAIRQLFYKSLYDLYDIKELPDKISYLNISHIANSLADAIVPALDLTVVDSSVRELYLEYFYLPF